MNISEHVAKLRSYMEFRNYSEQSIKNYCSNFTGFLFHFEKLNVTHPDRINGEMIIKFLKRFSEPATHSVDYVLNGQKSLQYSQRSVNELLKSLAEKAGIKFKRIYAHLLRHTSFTHMVESGADINLIQRLAGHSNVKTTLLYTHISHNLISKIQSPLMQINL